MQVPSGRDLADDPILRHSRLTAGKKSVLIEERSDLFEEDVRSFTLAEAEAQQD